MGPNTIFDKSALQALSIDETVWLEAYFLSNVTPLFYVETLADLYLIESVRRHGAGDADAALAAIDWAIKLRPGRMDLVFHARVEGDLN